MTDRKKLIELLEDAHREFYKKFDPNGDYFGTMADHLVANGVTFAKDTDGPGKWELDLSCLTPRERTAIQMYYEDAVSLTDVAVELELNYNRAAYVLDKAKRKLFKNIRITNRRKRPLPEPPKEDKHE